MQTGSAQLLIPGWIGLNSGRGEVGWVSHYGTERSAAPAAENQWDGAFRGSDSGRATREAPGERSGQRHGTLALSKTPATDVEHMSICGTMAGPSAESCVQRFEMVEPDEFLSLATSRKSLERSQPPGDGLVGLTDVASGRRVAVETQRLETFRLRHA